jgi:dockerin type I repeat protein
MVRRRAIILVVCVAALPVEPVRAVVIDDFSAGPFAIEVVRYETKSATMSPLPPGQALGGARYVTLNGLGPAATSTVRVSADAATSEFRYDADPGATAANFMVKYGATQSLQADLTADGSNAFVFDFAYANFEPGGGNFDIYLTTQPGGRYLYVPVANSPAPFSLVLPYQAFKTGTSGANFANVSAFSWGTGNGNLRGDFALSGIHTAYFPDGDFNFDGRVDSQDYQLWRSHYGQTSPAYPVIAADGNRDGKVDMGDYVLWRRGVTPTSGPVSSAVPEPRMWFMSSLAILSAAFRVRRAGDS